MKKLFIVTAAVLLVFSNVQLFSAASNRVPCKGKCPSAASFLDALNILDGLACRVGDIEDVGFLWQGCAHKQARRLPEVQVNFSDLDALRAFVREQWKNKTPKATLLILEGSLASLEVLNDEGGCSIMTQYLTIEMPKHIVAIERRPLGIICEEAED